MWRLTPLNVISDIFCCPEVSKTESFTSNYFEIIKTGKCNKHSSCSVLVRSCCCPLCPRFTCAKQKMEATVATWRRPVKTYGLRMLLLYDHKMNLWIHYSLSLFIWNNFFRLYYSLAFSLNDLGIWFKVSTFVLFVFIGHKRYLFHTEMCSIDLLCLNLCQKYERLLICTFCQR